MNTVRLSSILMGVSVVLSATAVNAGTFNSPYLFSLGTDALFCSATNVGRGTTSVQVQIVDSNGNANGNNASCVLNPNAVCQALGIQGGTGRCLINFTGSKNNLRGFFEIDDKDGNTKVGVPVN
jgi:hypothetical protein